MTWTIEIWATHTKNKPIMIGSNLDRELNFWLDMNRQADARQERSTGAKKGPRYTLKAYLHEVAETFKPGTGFDYLKGNLMEFKFDNATNGWAV